MIGLIQRVSQASVSVNQEVISEISAGGLLLLGIEAQDTPLMLKNWLKSY